MLVYKKSARTSAHHTQYLNLLFMTCTATFCTEPADFKQEPEILVPLSQLGPVFRLNDDDSLLHDYQCKDTCWLKIKAYKSTDCLEFGAYIKRQEMPTTTIDDTRIIVSGSLDSHVHGGLITARYFFATKEYFCTGSVKQPDKSYDYQYLDPSTFDILYRLFQQQEPACKQHEPIEKKFQKLAITPKRRARRFRVYRIHDG